jgi:selenocysteine lyase/cysteine desulfurase
VSSLDHDGGVAPWLELAHDRDLVVRHVELRDDTSLDLGDLERKLGSRTRVVAFAWASNAIGTLVDAARVCELAHSVGALAWIDAVHFAAHEPIDVAAVDADVLLCSPYKFCGPHLGLAFGRAEVLERWRPCRGTGRRAARRRPRSRRRARPRIGRAEVGARLAQAARHRLPDDVGHLRPARRVEEREVAAQGAEAAAYVGDVDRRGRHCQRLARVHPCIALINRQ